MGPEFPHNTRPEAYQTGGLSQSAVLPPYLRRHAWAPAPPSTPLQSPAPTSTAAPPASPTAPLRRAPPAAPLWTPSPVTPPPCRLASSSPPVATPHNVSPKHLERRRSTITSCHVAARQKKYHTCSVCLPGDAYRKQSNVASHRGP